MLRIVIDFHIDYAQASIFTQVNNGLSVGFGRGGGGMGGGGVGNWEEVGGLVGRWSVVGDFNETPKFLA